MHGMLAMLGEVPGLVGAGPAHRHGAGGLDAAGGHDSLMLAPLGPVPLAAVGLTGAVAVLFYAAIYGLLSALAVRIGAAHGAGAGRRSRF
jgi:multidrug resistance protein, MATE family